MVKGVLLPPDEHTLLREDPCRGSTYRDLKHTDFIAAPDDTPRLVDVEMGRQLCAYGPLHRIQPQAAPKSASHLHLLHLPRNRERRA
jgi:hypothetical protein